MTMKSIRYYRGRRSAMRQIKLNEVAVKEASEVL